MRCIMASSLIIGSGGGGAVAMDIDLALDGPLFFETLDVFGVVFIWEVDLTACDLDWGGVLRIGVGVLAMVKE